MTFPPAPPPADQPPPPPTNHREPKKKWYKRPVVIVLLSLLALMVACGVVVSTATKKVTGTVSASPEPAITATNPSGADGEQETTPAPPKAPAEPHLGTPVRDGKFEFTASKLRCGVRAIGTSPIDQKAQGQFCLLTLRVKNIGDESQMFDASSQKGFNQAGQEFSADGAASLYANPNGETFLTDINPGNTVSGVVVFDIPKGATLVRAELHDSAFSGGVTVALT